MWHLFIAFRSRCCAACLSRTQMSAHRSTVQPKVITRARARPCRSPRHGPLRPYRFSRKRESRSGLALFFVTGSRIGFGGVIDESSRRPLRPSPASKKSSSLLLAMLLTGLGTSSDVDPVARASCFCGWPVVANGAARPAGDPSRLLAPPRSRLPLPPVPSTRVSLCPPTKSGCLPGSVLDRGRIRRDLSQLFTLDDGETPSEVGDLSTGGQETGAFPWICNLFGRWTYRPACSFAVAGSGFAGVGAVAISPIPGVGAASGTLTPFPSRFCCALAAFTSSLAAFSSCFSSSLRSLSFSFCSPTQRQHLRPPGVGEGETHS